MAKPQRLMISWRSRNASSRQLRMADNAQVLIDCEKIPHGSLNTEMIARTLEALADHFATQFRLADDLGNFLCEVTGVERRGEKARGTVLDDFWNAPTSASNARHSARHGLNQCVPYGFTDRRQHKN